MSEEKLPSTNFIFVDRRNSKGKSIPNRQKLLKRIKNNIRNSVINVDSDGVGGNHTSSKNPIVISREILDEPVICYSRFGEYNMVLIGNDVWERGDEFPLDMDGEGSGSGSGQGAGSGVDDGEDDYVVNVSLSEFYDFFFEDCQLPDLKESSQKTTPEMVNRFAGYSSDGNPCQLSIKKSFIKAKSRRLVFGSAIKENIKQLEEQLSLTEENSEEYQRILELIEVEKQRIPKIHFFEEGDLRYRRIEQKEVKTADAVFIIIMDISGSMDQEKKMLARKFFSLQYAFMKRKYPQTDLVFIAHTETAKEMKEEDFFSTRISGGTAVSPAYELAHEIINSRYNPEQTNIYLSQASDGDNFESDNTVVEERLLTSGLMSKLRHMSYVNIGRFSSVYGIWPTLKVIQTKTKKLALNEIKTEEDVFTVFKKIYGKE